MTVCTAIPCVQYGFTATWVGARWQINNSGALMPTWWTPATPYAVICAGAYHPKPTLAAAIKVREWLPAVRIVTASLTTGEETNTYE